MMTFIQIIFNAMIYSHGLEMHQRHFYEESNSSIYRCLCYGLVYLCV